MRPTLRPIHLFSFVLAALVLPGAFCGQFFGTGPTPAVVVEPRPTPTPKPSVTVTPSPSPTPTVDPCNPVVGVNLSGPTEVAIGTTFTIHVTPVSSSGPLEGALDFCNNGRFVSADSISTNLRCVGSCSSFGPQFLAQGLGPYSVTLRVLGAAATFTGTVR